MKWPDKDQDNLRAEPLKLSHVSWALLKLLVYTHVHACGQRILQATCD